MELRHLRYFIAVAEELHFGRAAQVLGISQPPLSQQIQALEQQVGARLFERTNRRVELSEAGRLFLHEARLVLAQVDKAADVARRAQLGELGELKIGFTSSAPFNASIPQAIFAFRQAFPAVHLNLQEMSSTEVAESLVDESIQVGLMRPLPLPDSLSVIELMREPLVAVLNAGHRLVEGSERGLYLAQLAEEPFVFSLAATAAASTHNCSPWRVTLASARTSPRKRAGDDHHWPGGGRLGGVSVAGVLPAHTH